MDPRISRLKVKLTAAALLVGGVVVSALGTGAVSATAVVAQILGKA